MNCAINCIVYIMEQKKIPTDQIIHDLELSKSNLGISVYDLVRILNVHQVSANAYQSKRLPNSICILLLKGKKYGHYIVLLEKNIFTATIYDPLVAIKKINKLKLFLCWTHISIHC